MKVAWLVPNVCIVLIIDASELHFLHRLVSFLHAQCTFSLYEETGTFRYYLKMQDVIVYKYSYADNYLLFRTE